ncbi:hypothetical protein [Burkholderia cenocepacia]|uniref:hypothetical protein n=1 Tax=Burkholderia cenocepacia TaxID=95486 RepID=UPI00076D324B|nr:hypothetical protein [Burkholderia cenocepacia]KWU23354.1 hypothetical protein AS149_37420 [Burkholderia cenocepacia]
MAGDLHIRVCANREQKSVRRHDMRADPLGGCHSDDDAGRPTTEMVEARIGGRWYAYAFWHERFPDLEPEAYRVIVRVNRFYRHRNKGPDVWLGSLSRMGAAMGLSTIDEAIPKALQSVGALFGKHVFVKVTDELIAGVAAAFKDSPAHPVYHQAEGADVVAFLKAHRGKQVFLD